MRLNETVEPEPAEPPAEPEPEEGNGDDAEE
jgi:hypothetical protein